MGFDNRYPRVQVSRLLAHVFYSFALEDERYDTIADEGRGTEHDMGVMYMTIRPQTLPNFQGMKDEVVRVYGEYMLTEEYFPEELQDKFNEAISYAEPITVYYDDYGLIDWDNLGQKKKYVVRAEMISYYELEVEANSMSEAWAIGKAADGGDFTEIPHHAEWSVYDVVDI